MTIESFLTTDDVVAYLQVSRIAVYRMAGAGQIPAVRVGGQWRFRKSDIDACCKDRRHRPLPAP